ncbi:MAG TPA: tetratricopeptide repeat protein [Anaerolineae bacterium]|nr:tetratricopeptide repeat protein [Anaerolineae bacterium]
MAAESLALSRRLGRPDSIAHALDTLAASAACLGDYGEALTCIKEHQAICREMGDPFGIALSYNSLGWLAVYMKDTLAVTKALAYSKQAVAMFREIGHRSNLALSLGALALVAFELGEYEKGLPFAREGTALAAEIGNLDFKSFCLCYLGAIECGLGQTQAGRNHLLEALRIAQAKQMLSYIPTALFYLGALLAKESDAADVTEPLKLQQKAKALELLTLIGCHPITDAFIKDKAAPLQAELEADLPPEVATAVQERGKSRPLAEVVAEVLNTDC